MKTKLLLLPLLALVTCQPACTTESPGQSPAALAARERLNAALARLAVDTVALGELAAAGKIEEVLGKVEPVPVPRKVTK